MTGPRSLGLLTVRWWHVHVIAISVISHGKTSKISVMVTNINIFCTENAKIVSRTAFILKMSTVVPLLITLKLVLCDKIDNCIYFRVNTPRKQGGLGQMQIPLLADKTCDIAKRYGVYKEEDGISFRFVARAPMYNTSHQ